MAQHERSPDGDEWPAAVPSTRELAAAMSSEVRSWAPAEITVIRDDDTLLGELHPDRHGLGITVRSDGLRIPTRTAEQLFQALRFPGHPRVQAEIIDAKSAQMARNIARAHRAQERSDWTEVQDQARMYCTRLLLAQHLARLSACLRRTLAEGATPAGRAIGIIASTRELLGNAEYHGIRHDARDGTERWVGANRIGQTWGILREQLLRAGEESLIWVPAPEFADATLLDGPLNGWGPEDSQHGHSREAELARWQRAKREASAATRTETPARPEGGEPEGEGCEALLELRLRAQRALNAGLERELQHRRQQAQEKSPREPTPRAQQNERERELERELARERERTRELERQLDESERIVTRPAPTMGRS